MLVVVRWEPCNVGTVDQINDVNGSFLVTLNCYEALVFNLVLPFTLDGGATLKLSYDKLTNYCKQCHKLTPISSECPEFNVGSKRHYDRHDERKDSKTDLDRWIKKNIANPDRCLKQVLTKKMAVKKELGQRNIKDEKKKRKVAIPKPPAKT
ncbi:unnamed protein product [Cochlearia groenlandica]